MTNPTRQKGAALRVCASCEWIFLRPGGPESVCCPKCESGSYGAHWVYGRKCYNYRATQQRWLDKKVATYRSKLLNEIAEHQASRDPNDLFATHK